MNLGIDSGSNVSNWTERRVINRFAMYSSIQKPTQKMLTFQRVYVSSENRYSGLAVVETVWRLAMATVRGIFTSIAVLMWVSRCSIRRYNQYGYKILPNAKPYAKDLTLTDTVTPTLIVSISQNYSQKPLQRRKFELISEKTGFTENHIFWFFEEKSFFGSFFDLWTR